MQEFHRYYRKVKMEKRVITKREEETYRLRHHQFYGLSEEHTAMAMGISCVRVRGHLASMKKKAPQLFPVLSKTEAQIYHWLTVEGWSIDQIALHLDITYGAVCDRMSRLRRKLYFPKAMKRALRFDEDTMSDKVIHKF